jgi:hypothetical protein
VCVWCACACACGVRVRVRVVCALGLTPPSLSTPPPGCIPRHAAPPLGRPATARAMGDPHSVPATVPSTAPPTCPRKRRRPSPRRPCGLPGVLPDTGPGPCTNGTDSTRAGPADSPHPAVAPPGHCHKRPCHPPPLDRPARSAACPPCARAKEGCSRSLRACLVAERARPGPQTLAGPRARVARGLQISPCRGPGPPRSAIRVGASENGSVAARVATARARLRSRDRSGGTSAHSILSASARCNVYRLLPRRAGPLSRVLAG